MAPTTNNKPCAQHTGTSGLRSATNKRCKTFIKQKRWCVEHPVLMTQVLKLWQLRRQFFELFLKNFRVINTCLIGVLIRWYVIIRFDSDSHTQRYNIFDDTSKNYSIRFDSIQEYIDRYIDIMIVYTHFKQASTFLLTYKCNQKIYNLNINLKMLLWAQC